MKFKKSLASLISTVTLLSPICSSHAFSNNSENSEFDQTATETSSASSKLTQLGFTFSGEQTKDKINSDKLKLDLFEGDNLNTALMHGLDFIINDKTSPYIDNKESIVGPINKNELIKECLHSTVNYIKTKKENDNDKNLEIFKRLHTIEAMMKSDKNINNENVALRFISGMKCAYQMVISRSVAKSILEDNRDKIESKMGSESYCAGADLSSTIPGEGFNVGLSAGVASNQQATETSFYKIDNSGNLGISIGTGLKDYISANLGCAFEITNSLVFYSLEEFLDTGMAQGNISFLKLKDDNLKKVISSRKQMQNDEDTIMVKIKTSVEPFLKSAAIVPQNLSFKLPKATYSGNSEKHYKISASAKLAAEAKCMAKAGMNVSGEISRTKIKSYHPYLDLIDENFLITDYCTDIEDLITYLKISNTSKYKEIKENVSHELLGKNKNQKFSIAVSSLIGDLRRYNSALNVMADDASSSESKKSAKIIKKNIEKNWIGNSISSKNKHNRESMLKAAIGIGAYLRTLCESNEETKMFSELYDEAQNLSLLQKFTKKLFFNANQGFDTSRLSKKAEVRGETYVNIPFIGNTNLTVTYDNNESRLYSENSEDITITTQLPIINGKIYGCESLKDKLKESITKISKTNNIAALTLSDSLKLVDKNFDNIAASYGIEKTLSIPTVFSMKNYLNLHFYLTVIPKTDEPNDLMPLPDGNLIEKNKDSVVLKLTKRIDSLNTDLKISPEGATLSTHERIGKTSSKLGKDSLIFTVNKFNTCELGKSSASISGLWDRFKEAQKDSLYGLFENVTDNNSNVKYELQGIYSMIMKNIKNKPELSATEKSTMITATENIFRNFLNTCTDLKNSEDDTSKKEYYKKANGLLDSILKLNYEYVWYPALLAASNK